MNNNSYGAIEKQILKQVSILTTQKQIQIRDLIMNKAREIMDETIMNTIYSTRETENYHRTYDFKKVIKITPNGNSFLIWVDIGELNLINDNNGLNAHMNEKGKDEREQLVEFWNGDNSSIDLEVDDSRKGFFDKGIMNLKKWLQNDGQKQINKIFQNSNFQIT